MEGTKITYKQTLERIEKQKKAIDGYPVKFMFVGITEDYENVKEALKKQIPRKLIGAYCPSCNAIAGKGYSYCWHCGQALDWSDEK